LVRGAKAKDEGGWALPKVRNANRDLANQRLARWLTRGVIGFVIMAAIVRGLTLHEGADFQKYTIVLIYMIVALSATVLIGWAGQLSLGQFAFVGIGVYATGYYARELPYPVALAIGVAWGVGIAIVIGLPALRLKGLNLAIITLGFQLLCTFWLFNLKKLNNGSGRTMRLVHRHFLVWDLVSNKKAQYFVVLAFLAFMIFVVTMFRRSGIGRSVIAVRDNENSASAFTVSPVRAKLLAFAVSGGIAALAGGLYAAVFRQFTTQFLQPEESLRIVVSVDLLQRSVATEIDRDCIGALV